MPDEIKKAVVIGGSAGSVKVIFNLLKALPEDFPLSVIIALHRPEEENSHMGPLFKEISTLPFKEVNESVVIEPGKIYLAPSGSHIVVETDFTLNIDKSPLVQYSRPSIDVLFLSAAEVYKENLIGIILTGSNEDGALGLQSIQMNKGICIVQDPDDAAISRMPLAAISKTKTEYVFNKEQIYDILIKLSESELYNKNNNGYRFGDVVTKVLA